MGETTCPECAGIGNAVTKIGRNSDGRLSSVEFDLTKKCRTCGGIGKVLMRRGVAYQMPLLAPPSP